VESAPEQSTLSEIDWRKYMIGKQIQHYKILEKLGGGGMGIVYKAEDTKLQRMVALKFLPPRVSLNKEVKERFIHEARAASALDHNNICTIYEIGESEDGQMYMAMALYEGETLQAKIDKNPLPLENALNIAIQIAEGLSVAHQKDIVHRDIKPANIIITSRNVVKILDFGLAKLSGQTKLTKEGTTLGTTNYMSPEQIRGEELDNRTDIWALGVIIYEMVTGQAPFKGEYEQAVMYSIANEDPKPLTGMRSGVPMELERIVSKALAKDADERYQHLSDLMVDLKKLKKSMEGESSTAQKTIPSSTSKTGITTGAPKPQTSQKKSINKIIIASAVILLFVIAGVIFAPKLFTTKEVTTHISDRKMMVVLPFENLGAPDDEYFSDGMTEEITSRLSKLQGLGVISRTSALQYKKTTKSIKQIGDELGVEYVLEGTVRWQHDPNGKDRVRVSPQLIRVSDDTNIWTEQMDRAMAEIFQVQSEIAEQVVNQLDLEVLEPERRAIWTQPTKNLQAYDLWLQAAELEHKGDATGNIEEFEKSLRLTDKIIQLDPNFVLPYILQCDINRWLYFMGYDRTEQRLNRAKAAIDKALELQPQMAEALEALAFYYYHGFLDYDRALEIFAKIKEVRPNYNPWLLGFIQRRKGEWQQALGTLKESFELDPRNVYLAYEIGLTTKYMRQYSEAETWFDRALSIDAHFDVARVAKAVNLLVRNGDTKRCRIILEALPKNIDFEDSWILLFRAEKDYQKALDYFATVKSDALESQKLYFPVHWLRAWAYHQMKNLALAKVYADSALDQIQREIAKRPDDPRLYSALGLTYAIQGEKEKAIQAGKQALELYPMSKDVLGGADYVFRLAEIYSIIGDQDDAIDQLDLLLSMPSELSVAYLKIDSMFDPVRENPRFQQMIQKYSEKIN
jgi:serine/threonine protein kinase/tetratricopeptide (TPR) repeat protein